MALSLIEFGVYGFVTYSSLLMLIISVVKETPNTRSQSLVRSMYMIPGIICAILIMGSGPEITLTTTETLNNITAPSENFTEDITSTVTYTIVNPVWSLVHFFFAAIMTVYVIVQMVTLFTKV